MYHLPLLPGYGPHANIRSSASPSSEDDDGGGGVGGLSEAEAEVDGGYQGHYVDSETGVTPPSNTVIEGYMNSASDVVPPPDARLDEEEQMEDRERQGREPEPQRLHKDNLKKKERGSKAKEEEFAEAIFFAYGVVVFFGFTEEQERGILEDIEGAAALQDKLKEDEWEIEECHYAVCSPILILFIIVNLFMF